MLKIVVCDDDRTALDYVGKLIESCVTQECKISRYESGYAMELYVEETVRGNVDILFLDIELADCNGIEIAKRLKIRYPQIKIIFITGHIDYSQNIFEARPTYFLAKPVARDKLVKALGMALLEMEKDKYQTIAFAVKGTVMNVRFSDIKYIESVKRMILLHESDMQWEIYNRLDELEERLPGNFLRCHQSYIVNMDKVRYLNTHHFLLYDGELVPVSQSKYKKTKGRFMEYLGDSL